MSAIHFKKEQFTAIKTAISAQLSKANAKWVVLLLILPLLTLFSWQLLKSKPKNNLTNSIQTQRSSLIAPAIIDGMNDVTRVPSLQGGIIKVIHVTVGQAVRKGDPLFSLDKKGAITNLRIQAHAVKQAENGLQAQKNTLKNLNGYLKKLQSLDPRAISRIEIQQKKQEIKANEINLKQAQEHLAIMKKNLKNAKVGLNQHTTRAPHDGVVLQINTHVNEFIGGAQVIVLLADAKKVMVRVSIDERDTGLYQQSAEAYMKTPEQPDTKIPLQFVQLDRYIIHSDRLNARVQEALYFFNREDFPSLNLVAGQQFDVYISPKQTAA